MNPTTMIVKFGYWAGWHLGQPIAKKIGGAIAIGAGAVVGEVVARKVISKTVAKVEGGIESVKAIAKTGVALVQYIAVPAAKEKLASLFSRKGKEEEVAPAAQPTPVIVIPQQRVANPPAPKKVAVNIVDMEVFPPHNVAPGIPIGDLF